MNAGDDIKTAGDMLASAERLLVDPKAGNADELRAAAAYLRTQPPDRPCSGDLSQEVVKAIMKACPGRRRFA